MIIRKTTQADMPQVMAIYHQAREYQRNVLKLYQWADHYPGMERLQADIDQGGSYVVEVETSDGLRLPEATLVGTFYLQAGPDDTYLPLRKDWSDMDTLVTIHRLASDGRYPKLGHRLFEWAQTHYSPVMIDTHVDNGAMQHLIRKFGFTYLGQVPLMDGTLRDTFIWVKVEEKT